LRKDLVEVAEEKGKYQCLVEELTLEKDGLVEINEALHNQVCDLQDKLQTARESAEFERLLLEQVLHESEQKSKDLGQTLCE
jgi:hypothetical protein